jgi:hypothetical protein
VGAYMVSNGVYLKNTPQNGSSRENEVDFSTKPKKQGRNVSTTIEKF